MKNFIIILSISILLLSQSVFAQEEETLFDSIQNFDNYSKYKANPTNSQKEIDKALENVKNMHKSKWQLKKEKEKKGSILSDEIESIIKKPYLLLQIPYDIYAHNKVINKGFYKASYIKNNTLLLKQGHKIIAELQLQNAKAEPLNDDLYYIDSLPANGYLKIIYGAMDKHLENYYKIID